MSRLLITAAILLMTSGNTISGTGDAASRLLTDFTAATQDLGWYVVNDNVMGGRSEGGFDIDDGVLRFSGRTNTRGGGFSSIRTGPVGLDLSASDGVRLRVRGDGRRYTWQLRTDARVYGREVSYWADFETVDGDWQTADLPFERFVPKFRGAVLDGPPLNPSRITGMGLMIYDGRDGAFALKLDRVVAYAETASVSLEDLRWDHRVLVLSAPSAEIDAMREQRANVEATRAAFDERDMLLVVLVDDGESTAGERVLSDAAVADLRTTLRIDADEFALRLIGKDGGVKLSRDAFVPMTEIYELIDGMPMRRREMRDR